MKTVKVMTVGELVAKYKATFTVGVKEANIRSIVRSRRKM